MRLESAISQKEALETKMIEERKEILAQLNSLTEITAKLQTQIVEKDQELSQKTKNCQKLEQENSTMKQELKSIKSSLSSSYDSIRQEYQQSSEDLQRLSHENKKLKDELNLKISEQKVLKA